MSKLIYTKEKLEEAVAQSKCYTDVFNFLETNRGGNTYQRIKSLIKEYEIDTSHFWKPSQAGIFKAGLNAKKHYSELLISGYKQRLRSRQIRRALQESGEPYICKKCSRGPNWEGESLTLQVDHIDGDWSNCCKENLRFMCPNCHSQTTTFCNNGSGKIKQCENCYKKITNKSKWCKLCSDICKDQNRKIKNRPDLSVLLEDIEELGYVQTGKKYGVSDNSIRKWIKFETKKKEQG
jgi:hypothetical protein